MIVTIKFDNRTAENSISFRIERSACAAIMNWYGAYYAGDDYDVRINGRKQILGINGELEPMTIDAETEIFLATNSTPG